MSARVAVCGISHVRRDASRFRNGCQGCRCAPDLRGTFVRGEWFPVASTNCTAAARSAFRQRAQAHICAAGRYRDRPRLGLRPARAGGAVDDQISVGARVSKSTKRSVARLQIEPASKSLRENRYIRAASAEPPLTRSAHGRKSRVISPPPESEARDAGNAARAQPSRRRRRRRRVAQRTTDHRSMTSAAQDGTASAEADAGKAETPKRRVLQTRIRNDAQRASERGARQHTHRQAAQNSIPPMQA